MTDPRFNAPARLSDLRGDDLRIALIARHQAARDAFMARYLDVYPLNAARSEPAWKSVAACVVGVAAIVGMVLL